MNFTGSEGAYFILGVILIGWLLGIVVPPISAWNRSKYLDQWTGPNTARFRWKGYWWGYNKNTNNSFLIYNGPRLNFQIQTWRPRFAVWGLFKKRRLYVGLKQRIAKRFCIEAGKNNWYTLGADNPYNSNVYLTSERSMAIGALGWIDLIHALRYARTQSQQTFAEPISESPEIATLVTYCECNSFDCGLPVAINVDTLIGIRKIKGVIIVDGCKNGPSAGDTLLKNERGYSVYLEPS